MAGITIDVYSHHFKVTGFNSDGKQELVNFCRTHLAQWGLMRVGHNKFAQQIVRVYAGATRDRTEYRFHITLLEDVINQLKARVYSIEDINVVRHGCSDGVAVKFNTKSMKSLRDYQEPIVQYILEDNQTIRIVVLQTGFGKTLVALKSIADIGRRTVLVVKAMYVDRWVQAAKEELSMKPGELMVVRGTKDLNKLIHLGKTGKLKAKFIIISNVTMRIYFDAYEHYGTTEGLYHCDPEVFYETIGCGYQLIDEVHMDFFLNYRQYLYMNIKKTLALTATLTPETNFIAKMYDITFPKKLRYSGTEYVKYIKVSALEYKLKLPTKLRWIRRAIGAYSHVELEESIMKDKTTLRAYLNMINSVVYEYYIKVMEAGQKMLVFCATIEMCKLVVDDLRMRYPDVVIGKYTAEEDYSVLDYNEISVSTLLSAGTAVDIRGLRVTLMTTALNKGDSNEQALGRLRILPQWPDISPDFLYLFCRDIPQHVKYHEKKIKDFEGKVIQHKTLLMQDYI